MAIRHCGLRKVRGATTTRLTDQAGTLRVGRPGRGWKLQIGMFLLRTGHCRGDVLLEILGALLLSTALVRQKHILTLLHGDVAEARVCADELLHGLRLAPQEIHRELLRWRGLVDHLVGALRRLSW